MKGETMNDETDTYADQIMLIGAIIFLAINLWITKD